MDANDDGIHTSFVQILLEIAEMLSTAECMKFNDVFKDSNTYMPQTYVSYCFNMFSVSIKIAKNPHIVRKFKASNTIGANAVKITTTIQRYLIDQL